MPMLSGFLSICSDMLCQDLGFFLISQVNSASFILLSCQLGARSPAYVLLAHVLLTVIISGFELLSYFKELMEAL